MSKLSKHHFWEWFQRHHSEYLSLQKKSKKETSYWVNELNVHLRAYFKFLEFSLQCKKEQNAILTITVHGNAAHFKKVEGLVAIAPTIAGWRFVALEDPRPIDFLMKQQIEKTGIDPRELFFTFAGDSQKGAGLIIYHSLCTRETRQRVCDLANAAVYNLLGERSFGTDIAWIQVANLSSADPSGIRKLEELPDCVDLRRSGMVVDSEGKLVGMG